MKILVRTDDLLGGAMAGSAMRAWEIGRALENSGHTVLIEAAEGSSPPGPGPPVVDRSSAGSRDVLIVPPWSVRPTDFLHPGILVIDGVTPLIAELETFGAKDEILRRKNRALARLPLVLARADLLLVAGRAQREYWKRLLGTRRKDLPILDLPFGISNREAREDFADIPGLPDDHAAVLWWGGVWPWLDLETLLAARARLGKRKISLLVPVGSRPGSTAGSFGPEDLADAMARHGLHPPDVIGLREWTPYVGREKILNRASILAVLHHPGAEAELSFRTRAMDGVWAGVPLLLSEGGEVASLAKNHGWGMVVRPGDIPSTAAAIDLLLRNSYQFRAREALEKSRPHWSWKKLVEPLARILPTLPACPKDSRVFAGFKALQILLFGEKRSGTQW